MLELLAPYIGYSVLIVLALMAVVFAVGVLMIAAARVWPRFYFGRPHYRGLLAFYRDDDSLVHEPLRVARWFGFGKGHSYWLGIMLFARDDQPRKAPRDDE